LYGTDVRSCTVQLDEFLKFCRVDLRLSARTVERNRHAIRRILEVCGPNPTRVQLRDFPAYVENGSTRDNYIKAMRAYFRDYLGRDIAWRSCSIPALLLISAASRGRHLHSHNPSHSPSAIQILDENI
jgi:hypothetical protein